MAKFDKAAIIMGLTVNGLVVLRSLCSFGVNCFGLFSNRHEELGIYSKYLLGTKKIKNPLSNSELFSALGEITDKYSLNKPVLITTTDSYAEFISKNQDELRR